VESLIYWLKGVNGVGGRFGPRNWLHQLTKIKHILKMSDFQVLSRTGVWLSATERVSYATFVRLFKSVYATKRVV